MILVNFNPNPGLAAQGGLDGGVGLSTILGPIPESSFAKLHLKKIQVIPF